MAQSNGNSTSRPALVIGVGGTGQWVLAYLKKDLIESYGGKVPSNIRLLGIDTMPMSEGNVGGNEIATIGDGSSSDKNTVAHAGAVKLDSGKEFLYLGGDAYPVADYVKKGGHPHIGAWFDAETYLKNLPKASFILDEGAGRIRQFGHLAIAMDSLEGKAGSKLYRALEGALSTVSGNSDNKHVDIIIVGSFAGGTGSGMYVDVAWMARKISEINKISVSLRGYFVLPKAFAQHDQEMMARSFAAWRELNRFMSQGVEIGSPKMILAPKQKEFEIDTNRRLFDACYLVDSWLGTEQLQAKPRFGIFPSIADAISTILDSEAGGTYVQHVERNLSPHYNNYPGQPMYSTLSTYTFKVPIYYYQQEFSYGLAREVLECLLAPHSNGHGGWSMAADQNPENAGQAGSSESLGILHSARQDFKDEMAFGNLFTFELSDIAQNHEDGQTFQDHLNRSKQSAARGGKASGTWVDRFADFGNALTIGSNKEHLERLKLSLNSELKFDLATALPTSDVGKDDLPKQVRKIEESSDALLIEHYGTPETSGSFNKLLQEVSDFQLENFKRLLRLWTLRTLNGTNRAQPELALSGKLGYARSCVNGLHHHLANVESFLGKVEKQRAADTPELELMNRVDRAKNRAKELARSPWFWGLIANPSAKPGIQQYRLGLNRVGLLAREIAALTEVRKTISRMIDSVAIALHELDACEQALLSDPNTGYEGLFPRTNQKLDEIRVTHQEDRNLKAIQRVFEQTDVLDENGKMKNQEAIQNTLKYTAWDYTSKGLQLTISPPDMEPIILKIPGPKDSAELREQINKENLDALLALGRSRYSISTVTRSVAVRLKDDLPDYNNVVDILFPKFFNTLFQRSQYVNPDNSAKAHSWYIRVNQTGADPKYFSELISKLASNASTNPEVSSSFPIETVGSANPHKMTAIRTADCWFPDAFVTWHDCLQAFRDEIDAGHDVSLYHVYAAERNAVRLELQAMRKFPRDRGVYQPFHPRIVMLLNNEQRLRNFLMCWVLGFIEQKEDGDKFYWELCLPNGTPLQLTRSQTREPDDILFRMMNNFVLVGKDMKAGAGLSINEKAVEQAVSDARKALGLEEMIAKMQAHTTQPAGAEVSEDAPLSPRWPLAPWLEARAKVSSETRGETDELVAERPEYWDLATVIRLIFSEEIDANKKRIAQKKD